LRRSVSLWLPALDASLPMSTAVQTMLDVLDLEQLEVNLFRGRSPQDRWQRVFGGQVIGQALVAASRTVEGIRCTPIFWSAAIRKCRSSTR
jgi:acyl-CoA thioesterase